MKDESIHRLKLLAGIQIKASPSKKVTTESKLLTEGAQDQLVQLLFNEAEARAANEASMGRGALTADAILAHAQRISTDVMTHVESLIRMEFEEGRQ